MCFKFLSGKTNVLYSFFHKTVLVAVNIKIASATKLNSCFRITFRIKFNKLNSVSGYISYKGYEMFFAHFVVDSYKFFIFNIFKSYSVVTVSFLSFKGRKSYTAAAYNCFTGCAYNIAAYWTNIKLWKQYICWRIFVYYSFFVYLHFGYCKHP